MRSKLILFFFISSIGPLILLTVLTTLVARDAMLTISEQRIEARVDASVDRIESYLNERQSDARVVAALPTIRLALQPELEDVVRSTTELSPNETLDNQAESEVAKDNVLRIMREVKNAYDYSAVSILNDEGTVILSTDDILLDQKMKSRPEIEEALSGNSNLSEVCAKDHFPVAHLHITHPIKHEGEVIGVLDIISPLDAIHEMIAFDTNRTGEGSYSVILDNNLVRISNPAHPDYLFRPIVPLPAHIKTQIRETNQFGKYTDKVLNNPTDLPEVAKYANEIRTSAQDSVIFQGVSGSTNVESESMIKEIDVLGWYYLHRVPISSFYQPINNLLLLAGGVLGGTIIIAIVAVLWFASMLNTPLNHLVAVSTAIAKGDLSRRADVKTKDEFRTLADSFNTMAETLESRIKSEQENREKALALQEVETKNRQALEETIGQQLAFVRKVAQGNLNQQLQISEDGSLGALAQELNGMVNSLRTITEQVKTASSDIAGASSDILSTTTQQASSATQQSSAITEATTSVDQVKSIAQQTAQQANILAQESQATLQVSRKGTQKVQDAIDGMEQIRERVQSIAQTILALSEQTQAIGTIITTVGEIADQSNLLALNAAIEAARAGEQGKSFAVVAQQVRELAERSKDATRQVQDILGEIQRATNTAVMVTEEGTKGVETGVVLTKEAGQVIEQIAAEVESGAQSNAQMATASYQQTTGMEQIGQAMRSIQQATNQALASTRQAENVARNLHTLSESLQDAIAAYKL
jgi:methyl-accepting chemotaxis protein